MYLNLTTAAAIICTYGLGAYFKFSWKLEYNTNGDTYVAYCFAEKQGYSKFGSYVGNGNADGPFVYTGFKPAFVMIKRTEVQWNGLYKILKRGI